MSDVVSEFVAAGTDPWSRTSRPERLADRVGRALAFKASAAEAGRMPSESGCTRNDLVANY
jgi:hypothetical protein